MTKVFTEASSINGTSLKGYITTTYDQLLKVFGEPTSQGGDKTNVGWELEFYDGTVATIYDWKTFDIPMSEYRWHIGGYNSRAVDLIHDTFEGRLTEEILELMEEDN